MEVLHDRGSARPAGVDRWTGGSGYLIGGRLVLTAAHAVDYRQVLGGDERLLVRMIDGSELAARVVLVCDEPSGVDLALLEINEPSVGDRLPTVTFARVNRDSAVPVAGCWAVGFPRFGEAGPVLPEGSRRETRHVGGNIWPGGKLRAGLLTLEVTSNPRPLPASVAGSEWEGMSGAVVFANDARYGEQAIGVVSTHHRAEGESALTVVPIASVAGLPTSLQWWQQLGVTDPDALPVQPPLSAAAQQRSRLSGELALKEHWDPRGRGVERAARPGWFFTGRRLVLSDLVAWLCAVPDPKDNVRVVTGGPGSGKSAVLARLVTMSDLHYRVGMPTPLATDDPVAGLPPDAIDVAVHARAASTDEVISALAAAAGAPQSDLDGVIETLLEKKPGTFTIVVDALDEANNPHELALALCKLAGETADKGVRLLVGTRPGGPDRRLITDLGRSARGDRALIDLDAPAFLSRDDLAEYVRRRLLLSDVPPGPGRRDTPYRGREALAGQAAAAVAVAAYPAFLIGQLVSRALLLRAQPISPHDPGWQQFPKTVADAMDQYLAGVGDQAEQDRVEDLLRPLAYARGDGLPLDDARLWPELATALARPGRRYTVDDVAALLDTAADYLVETVITGEAAYYRLYHQALSDRLRARDQQHLRPVSVAQTIYECLLGTVTRRPNGTRDWPTAHPYLRSQLAGYAADAGQLLSLLDDPGFLAAADPVTLAPLIRHHDSVQLLRYPPASRLRFGLVTAITVLAGIIAGGCMPASLSAPLPGWPVVFPAAVLAAAVTRMLIASHVLERRHGLIVVSADSVGAALSARVAALTAGSGIGRMPILMANPRVLSNMASVYGLPGRYRIALSGGLLVAASRRPDQFDVAVTHELAHVRNKDVFPASFAISCWITLLPVLAVPLVLRMVDRDFAFAVGYLACVAGLAFTVYLIRATAFRSCEHYADIRAVSWSRRVEPFTDMLEGLNARSGRPFASWLAHHPSPSTRAGTLRQPSSLGRAEPLEFLAVGLTAGVGLPLMLCVFSGVPGITVVRADFIARFVLFGLLGAYIAAVILRAAVTRQLSARTSWLPCAALIAGVAVGMLIPVSGTGLMQCHVDKIADAVVAGTLTGGAIAIFALHIARLPLLYLQELPGRRIAGLILMGALFAALAADAALALSVHLNKLSLHCCAPGPAANIAHSPTGTGIRMLFGRHVGRLRLAVRSAATGVRTIKVTWGRVLFIARVAYLGVREVSRCRLIGAPPVLPPLPPALALSGRGRRIRHSGGQAAGPGAG